MLLRQFTLDDVDDVLALDSDAEVGVFVEDGEPVNRDEITSMIEHWMGYYDRSETLVSGLRSRRTRGSSWVVPFRPCAGAAVNEPELGYRLVSAAWGRGYTSEGSRALRVSRL